MWTWSRNTAAFFGPHTASIPTAWLHSRRVTCLQSGLKTFGHLEIRNSRLKPFLLHHLLDKHKLHPQFFFSFIPIITSINLLGETRTLVKIWGSAAAHRDVRTAINIHSASFLFYSANRPSLNLQGLLLEAIREVILSKSTHNESN